MKTRSWRKLTPRFSFVDERRNTRNTPHHILNQGRIVLNQGWDLPVAPELDPNGRGLLWRHLRAPRSRLESAAPASNRSPIGKPVLARRGSSQPQPVLPLASPDDWDAPPLAVGAPPTVLPPLALLPPATVLGAPDAPAPPPPFVAGAGQPVAAEVPPSIWDATPPEAPALHALPPAPPFGLTGAVAGRNPARAYARAPFQLMATSLVV